MVAGAVSKCFGTHGTGTTVLTIVISAILYFVLGLVRLLSLLLKSYAFFIIFIIIPYKVLVKQVFALYNISKFLY